VMCLCLLGVRVPHLAIFLGGGGGVIADTEAACNLCLILKAVNYENHVKIRGDILLD